MLELLQNQSASEDMPVFVICSPAEVPCIPAVAYSRIASKLNEIQQTLLQVNEKMSTYDLNFPSLPSSAIGSDISKATVIIANVSRDVDNASKRKKRIDCISGHECIDTVRASGDKLIVKIDSVAAADFCKSARSVFCDCEAKMVEKKFFCIMKGVAQDLDFAPLKACRGVRDAMRIGSSNCVKITFKDEISLSLALKSGLKIGYELFRVYEYWRIPRCCRKCQSPDHLAAKCPDQNYKCSQCSGPHMNSSDSPCSNTPKCANCSGDHVAYSFRCSKLKALANSKVPRPSRLQS